MFPKAKIYSMVWVIISLVALVGLEQSSAVEILDCNPGSPLVVEEAFTNVQIICISIQMGFEVLWYFNVTQENQSTRLRAVHCLRNVMCIGQLPFTSIYRLPHTTALSVTEYIKYFNLTAVTCTERHPYTGKENSYSCSVQIIRAPEISCTVHFSTDTAPGEGHCDVQNIYFIERPYTCIWYQINMKSGERTKIAHIHVTNYVDHGYHVSGTCTTIISQPTSGQFTYEILLLPEGLRVKAAKSDALTQK